MKYINVAIDNKSRYTDQLYTYGCNHDEIQVGQKVLVPFNRGNRPKDAYVFQVMDTIEEEFKNLKYVEEIDDDIRLTEEIIQTCAWMKQRYLCKYIDGIKCFTPSGSKSKTGKIRNPFLGAKGQPQPIQELTEEQKAVLQPLLSAISQNTHKRFLLHGITGSGKTEIYMQTISACLDKGKQAIMLVPEISLTKQIIDRFIGRFGAENIAVLHSKLSMGERYDEWIRIRQGKVKIVIGARSAVFAPLERIGAIILDEEHEGTYKSDMSPKYDTVEVALKRLQTHRGILLLGSATPGVVSYFRAQTGLYEKLTLTKRYNQVSLPMVEIIDMRAELREGNKSILSRKLYEMMNECLSDGRQVILFLNRRGYSTFISCRECGAVIKCPDCGITLTFHKGNRKTVCHYCGYTEEPRHICPDCGSKYIRYFGTGTEKVEEAVSELFPKAVITRLDLDSTKKKGSLDKLLTDFGKGKSDILIGTQLVAKGLDFKNVGLVGIVSADISLNIPDFRSPERTFQLITQAAGRAGRGETAGKVIIQTYVPENYAIQYAADQDYQGFYEAEIFFRNSMNYPPYSDLIQVVFSSENQQSAKMAGDLWHDQMIKQINDEEKINVFRPQPAELHKIKELYRYTLLIKCPQGKRKHYTSILERIMEGTKSGKKDYMVTVDINPYSFV